MNGDEVGPKRIRQIIEMSRVEGNDLETIGEVEARIQWIYSEQQTDKRCKVVSR